MKLNALIIFFIILASLLLCNCLGKPLYEGMENHDANTDTNTDANTDANTDTSTQDNGFDEGDKVSYGSLLVT